MMGWIWPLGLGLALALGTLTGVEAGESTVDSVGAVDCVGSPWIEWTAA